MDQRNRGRRPRQRRPAGGEGPQRPARPVARAHDGPDLPDILGRFSDALSMLSVVSRSLAARDFAGTGDEEIALRRAIDELKAVYNELDAAAARIGSAATT